MLEDAFKMALRLTERAMTIQRPDVFSSETVYVSKSNYQRNLQVIEDVETKQTEWVISKERLLETVQYQYPKRGDVLIDSELGAMTITTILPMQVLGGIVVGWRIRTE